MEFSYLPFVLIKKFIWDIAFGKKIFHVSFFLEWLEFGNGKDIIIEQWSRVESFVSSHSTFIYDIDAFVSDAFVF